MPDKSPTILFLGDIVGKPGRKAIAQALPNLRKEYSPDLVIANAENLAHGVGITPKTLAECREAGIDFFTSGNHVWRKESVNELFKDPDIPLIRPANYPVGMPGCGYKTVSLGSSQLLMINLNGQVFIEGEFSSPFSAIDEILSQFKNIELGGILVDFHAEATSEKVAFGLYTDGRVSAVLGTHTHIPTADERILPGGTAYITDVGMVGLKDSVIGVDKHIIIEKFLTKKGHMHDIPEQGLCIINAVMVQLNTGTKKADAIKRIYQEIEV
jgi:2',3'-cyclic-nucleotide 2'-phosphodiesterase